MRRISVSPSTLFVLTVVLLGLAGCDGFPVSGNGNENENRNGDTDLLDIVDTGWSIGSWSILRVSDRFLAYRSADDVATVYDIQTDTVMDVPTPEDAADSHEWHFYNDFAVAGSWVILAGPDDTTTDDNIYAFHALDPDAGTQRVGEVKLLCSIYSHGDHIHSDGGDIVAFMTSDRQLGWVDVSVDQLSASVFNREGDYATNMRVNGAKIAVIDTTEERNDILIFDTTTPDADPQVFTSTNVSYRYSLVYEGDYILFVGYDILSILNVTNGTIYRTDLEVRGGEQLYHSGSIDIDGGVFCGFTRDGHTGANYQSFIGHVGNINPTDGSNAYTLVQDEYPRPPYRAFAGWGTTCAVANNGQYVFVAGCGEPYNSMYNSLSVWIDGFAIAETEFDGNYVPDTYGAVSASGVIMGNGIVFFRLSNGEVDAAATLGYIRLP